MTEEVQLYLVQMTSCHTWYKCMRLSPGALCYPLLYRQVLGLVTFFLILLFEDTLTTSESPTVTTGTPLTVTTSAPSPGPLKVYFSGNTPHVVENTVTVQVFANKPASAICRLGYATPLPCKQFPQCHNITFCTQRILNTLYFIMHDAVFFTMGSAKHNNPCYHTHSFYMLVVRQQLHGSHKCSTQAVCTQCVESSSKSLTWERRID